jgi:hypothetical protein
MPLEDDPMGMARIDEQRSVNEEIDAIMVGC